MSVTVGGPTSPQPYCLLLSLVIVSPVPLRARTWHLAAVPAWSARVLWLLLALVVMSQKKGWWSGPLPCLAVLICLHYLCMHDRCALPEAGALA